jgi:glutamate--cysteine ligase
MTALPSSSDTAPIEHLDQLTAWFAGGCKPVTGPLRVGTEHEKFMVNRATGHPVPYAGDTGIRAVLEGLTAFGWEPVLENGNPIALVRDGAAVSLEPGGQLELSGAPLVTLHETACETRQHFEEVQAVCDVLGLDMLMTGFHPDWQRENMPWMPKGRYDIMGDYMPKRGTLGLDMMLRTCTIQANLDYTSEGDMVDKFRAALALQPVATALFANSPFRDGQDTGFQSFRSQVWTDTDPDRCGVPGFVFEDSMGFERYRDYALDVPMYFVYREGRYLDASGQNFRDFLAGRLPALPGELPTLADWANHLSTLFPEVRLKRYLEMRGADCGPESHIVALPALWTGLLYDQQALDGALELVNDWTPDQHQQIRQDVPRHGLKTPVTDQQTLGDVAAVVLELADAGLARRAQLDARGQDERQYLDPLREILEQGQTLADVMRTDRLAAFTVQEQQRQAQWG